jgi:nitrogenase molybdenum-iron protein alpha chain
MSNATGERNLEIIQEVLEIFPEKTRKERRKHMMVTDPEMESVGKCIISNRKSQPGVMTVRGCSYAGSKGVVFGPIKDMAHISHGPIGCGQYSRAGRRNYYTGVSGVDSFGTLNFTSDFQERDIVFGGDKKLSKLIEEMEELFPLTKGISIQSECPVGLIGDDIEAVANASKKALNKP